MNSSTWLTRELPILQAIVRAEEAVTDVQAAARAAAPELSGRVLMQCLARLGADGYLEVAESRNGASRRVTVLIERALPRAFREVGVWPATATPIEEKRRRRFAFMDRLYERTDGNPGRHMQLQEVATELGWTNDEAYEVAQYLAGEGLARFPAAGLIALAHAGVVEMEQAIEHPHAPTTHLLPTSVVNVFGDVVDSQIQSGTTASSQSTGLSLADQRSAIEAFLEEFRLAIEARSVTGEETPEASAYVSAVESQLVLRAPNETIVRESLRSLRSIAENLAASGVFVGLVELAAKIRL